LFLGPRCCWLSWLRPRRGTAAAGPPAHAIRQASDSGSGRGRGSDACSLVRAAAGCRGLGPVGVRQRQVPQHTLQGKWGLQRGQARSRCSLQFYPCMPDIAVVQQCCRLPTSFANILLTQFRPSSLVPAARCCVCRCLNEPTSCSDFNPSKGLRVCACGGWAARCV
jgi:hypothetical protein